MNEPRISQKLKIQPVVRKARLNEIDEAKEDVQYWLSKPIPERIAAVTFLVLQSLAEGEHMDKSVIMKKRLKQI